MKITAVKTVVVNAKLRNWIFVRVETDVPGLVGLGEATLEFQTRAVVGAIEDLAPLVIGDVMYVHTPFPNIVYALDLNNDGKILWKYEPRQDENGKGAHQPQRPHLRGQLR